MTRRLLVDGREFVVGRRTGIGRFLEGLLLAVLEAHPDWRITIAMRKRDCALPASLDGRVGELFLPPLPELFWPLLARGHDLFVSPYPKLPLRRLPCPAVHTVHDVFYLTHPLYRKNVLRSFVGKQILRRSLKLAALSWFVSESSHAACEVLFGKAPETRIRHLPVDAIFIPDMNIAPARPPFFLYVGNGLPHKNVETLLEAVSGTDLKLRCLGISEAQRQLLQRVAPANVEMTQTADDVMLVAMYRQATALLLPSEIEGYGLPPLEAMACGTPAIVSDIPVLRETTGGAAVYCPAHDALAWREAMQSMLDATVRDERSSQALAWAAPLRGSAGWRAFIADLENVMEDAG